MPKSSRGGGWIKNIADIAVIVLIMLAAKTAIAEPRAIGIDGADASDRRRIASDKVPIRLQRRLAAVVPRSTEHATCSLHAAQTWRRGRILLAR